MPDIFSMFGGKPSPHVNTLQRPITKVPAKQFLAQYMASPMYQQRLKNFQDTAQPNIKDFLNTNIVNGPHNVFGGGSHALTKTETPKRDANNSYQFDQLGYKHGKNNVYIDRDQIGSNNNLVQAAAGPEFLQANALPPLPVKTQDGIGTMYAPNVLAHELSHVSRNLSNQEQSYIANKNLSNRNKQLLDFYLKNKKKMQGVDYNTFVYGNEGHDDVPGELKADLDSFRYQLFKQGIYDTKKSQMNMQHIEKAKQNPQINTDFQFQRLLQHFTPEDIIKLNNTVAFNTQPNTNGQYNV